MEAEVKKTQQCLHFLRLLRNCHLKASPFRTFYPARVSWCTALEYGTAAAQPGTSTAGSNKSSTKYHQLPPDIPGGNHYLLQFQESKKDPVRPLTPRPAVLLGKGYISLGIGKFLIQFHAFLAWVKNSFFQQSSRPQGSISNMWRIGKQTCWNGIWRTVYSSH